jgi:hypothetical protein
MALRVYTITMLILAAVGLAFVSFAASVFLGPHIAWLPIETFAAFGETAARIGARIVLPAVGPLFGSVPLGLAFGFVVARRTEWYALTVAILAVMAMVMFYILYSVELAWFDFVEWVLELSFFVIAAWLGARWSRNLFERRRRTIGCAVYGGLSVLAVTAHWWYPCVVLAVCRNAA